MIINMWNRVSIYCLNHEKPQKMEVIKNVEKLKSPFYGCNQYMEETPEGESPCPNRLNMDDYQGIVLKFLDYVASDGDKGIVTDYTNFTFEYRGGRHKTFVKVLKYSDDEIRLGILNKTVLGK